MPNGVNLRIVKPEEDKGYMIGFDAKSDDEAEAYNEATEFYLRNAKLPNFHQAGHEGGAGYSGWEIRTEVEEKTLTELLPKKSSEDTALSG